MTTPRISVSNIGWLSREDTEIAALLTSRGVTAIDLTMGRYFDEPHLASSKEWQSITKWWRDRGFAIPAVQSLLFGVGLRNIFAGTEDRNYLHSAMSRVISLAADAEIPRLVFGSPQQRKRLSLNQSEFDIAQDFFSSLGSLAASHEVSLLIEPNSRRHGCNFLNTAREALDFVSMVGSQGLGVNLDLGSEPQESLPEIVGDLGQFGHLHVSTETLEPLSVEMSWVAKLQVISDLSGFEFVTIEQLASPDKPNSHHVARSLELLERAINGA